MEKSINQKKALVFGFPEGVNPDSLKWESYTLGNRLIKAPSTDINFFGSVQFISVTKAPKTKQERFQAVAWNPVTNDYYSINLIHAT